jgi:hypothetical protein
VRVKERERERERKKERQRDKEKREREKLWCGCVLSFCSLFLFCLFVCGVFLCSKFCVSVFCKLMSWFFFGCCLLMMSEFLNFYIYLLYMFWVDFRLFLNKIFFGLLCGLFV